MLDFFSVGYRWLRKQSRRTALFVTVILTVLATMGWIVTNADAIKKFAILIGIATDPNDELRMKAQNSLVRDSFIGELLFPVIYETEKARTWDGEWVGTEKITITRQMGVSSDL